MATAKATGMAATARARARWRDRSSSTRGERWALAQFVLSGLAAVVLVLVLVLVAVGRAARAEAIASAKEVTQTAAVGVIAPLAGDAALRGDARAVARLDARVRGALLREPVLRVVVYRADGRVVYSSGPERRGSRVAVNATMARALATGRAATHTGAPQDPGADVPSSVGLLDVYQPVVTASGETLVVQSCRRLASVSAASRELLGRFAPWLIGGVLALQLLHLPLALGLIRRVRSARRREEALLQREIAASDRERRRLASDLHNGVIQEIAGMSMALTAARATATARGDDEAAARLEEVAAGSRRTTRTLRHMLVDIYPPNLQRAGLRSALADLLEGVRQRDVGVDAALADELDGLSVDTAAVVYRVVQEAVRNVVAHAGASVVRVEVDVSGGGGGGGGGVRACVADDGRGFEVDGTGARGGGAGAGAGGHLGLALMRDLVEQSGGTLRIDSRVGEGTTVRAKIPGVVPSATVVAPARGRA